MSRVIKIVKGIRNHWKKSAFAAAVITYGVNYVNESSKIKTLMRELCAEAAVYGEVSQPATAQFSKVIVLLNPTADRRSATTNYDEYCAPILHLGGLEVDVIKTDSEGHARRYIEEIDILPEVILCAGGDGTLSEIVTGLLRRQNLNENLPVVGVLPVGRTNTMAKTLFNFSTESRLNRTRGLATATLAVVRGKTSRKDVMKIEPISDDNRKPIYAIGTIEWGAYRDAFNFRDKYWYFGSLRDHMTFIFNAFSNSITWNCKANITYTDACTGCNNCREKPLAQNQPRRWWSGFVRIGAPKTNEIDYSKIKNDQCAVEKNIDIEAQGIQLATANASQKESQNELALINLKLANESTGFEFITNSWNRLKTDQFDTKSELAVRTVKIIPENYQKSEENDDNEKKHEKFYSIDNEAFEVLPINVTLIPSKINFYVQ